MKSNKQESGSLKVVSDQDIDDLRIFMKVGKDSEFNKFAESVRKAGILSAIFRKAMSGQKMFMADMMDEETGVVASCLKTQWYYQGLIEELEHLNHWYVNEFTYFMDKTEEEQIRYVKISAFYFKALKHGNINRLMQSVSEQDLSNLDGIPIEIEAIKSKYLSEYERYKLRVQQISNEIRAILN